MSKREQGGVVEAVAGAQGGGFRLRLQLAVVLCGGSLMGLEMAGVRMLEPYFGSTIYVWGSIIGIFLGALSLGYWLGGRLSDRMPSLRVLGWLVLAAAVLVFLIPPLASPIGHALQKSAAMGPKLKAFLGSLALYALPSVLLGMVSPFAVRLSITQLHTAGKVAGNLYALGTLGSILGTFLTTFILTDWIGTTAIVWGVGAVLALVACLCLWGGGVVRSAPCAAAVLLLLPGWAMQTRAEAAIRHDALMYPPQMAGRAAHGGEADRHLETVESAYHRISVIESEMNLETAQRDPGGCRYMLFNNQVESGVRIEGRVEGETSCGYVRLLHLGVLATGTAPRNVLIIGGGGGIGPQAFWQDYRSPRIDVVDIDPEVFRLAGAYFHYPYAAPGSASGAAAHPSIRSHVTDGRMFLAQSPDTWDYVVLDAYTSGGRIPKHLISQEFFALAKAKMTADGVLVANIISSLDGSGSRLYRSVAATMASVFGNVVTFPRYERGNDSENLILVSTVTAQELSASLIRQRYQALGGSLLRQPGLAQAVRQARTLLPDGGVVLTDDYCPVDSMVTH